MWPCMGQMGWWMTVWWGFGVGMLVLLVWAIVRVTGGYASPGGDSPETILKRRYARGELDRDEYLRCLDELTR
jgi:putative membrane protein